VHVVNDLNTTSILIYIMNWKIKVSIFGRYDPYIVDADLAQLYLKYKSSDGYKLIKEEETKYLLEKWYNLRNCFESETLAVEIENINDEFKHKGVLQQRKLYYETNRDKELEYNRQYKAAHKEEGTR